MIVYRAIPFTGLIILFLLFVGTVHAEVVRGATEIMDMPNGIALLKLDNGVGVQVLETNGDWSKIRFRITNPSTTIDGDYIKTNVKLYIFAQDFNWTKKYKSFGKTLTKVKIDRFPMLPLTKTSGYISGYIKTANLTMPTLENYNRLTNLQPSYYFRLDLVDLKAKTYDTDAATEYSHVFCDFQVIKGERFEFVAGNYLEALVSFFIDMNGNISGDTCFDTFCIEKLTIEGPDMFSAIVSGIKQSFISTKNMKNYSTKDGAEDN